MHNRQIGTPGRFAGLLPALLVGLFTSAAAAQVPPPAPPPETPAPPDLPSANPPPWGDRRWKADPYEAGCTGGVFTYRWECAFEERVKSRGGAYRLPLVRDNCEQPCTSPGDHKHPDGCDHCYRKHPHGDGIKLVIKEEHIKKFSSELETGVGGKKSGFSFSAKLKAKIEESMKSLVGQETTVKACPGEKCTTVSQYAGCLLTIGPGDIVVRGRHIRVQKKKCRTWKRDAVVHAWWQCESGAELSDTTWTEIDDIDFNGGVSATFDKWTVYGAPCPCRPGRRDVPTPGGGDHAPMPDPAPATPDEHAQGDPGESPGAVNWELVSTTILVGPDEPIGGFAPGSQVTMPAGTVITVGDDAGAEAPPLALRPGEIARVIVPAAIGLSAGYLLQGDENPGRQDFGEPARVGPDAPAEVQLYEGQPVAVEVPRAAIGAAPTLLLEAAAPVTGERVAQELQPVATIGDRVLYVAPSATKEIARAGAIEVKAVDALGEARTVGRIDAWSLTIEADPPAIPRGGRSDIRPRAAGKIDPGGQYELNMKVEGESGAKAVFSDSGTPTLKRTVSGAQLANGTLSYVVKDLGTGNPGVTGLKVSASAAKLVGPSRAPDGNDERRNAGARPTPSGR